MPSAVSISFCTSKTVHDTGNREVGSSIQLCTRPVREISEGVIKLGRQDMVVDNLVPLVLCHQL